MKYLFFAALTALAVIGSTTVKNTPVLSDMKTAEPMLQKDPADVSSIIAAGAVGETFLYIAMTKYEFMNIAEIISTGGQQEVLERILMEWA